MINDPLIIFSKLIVSHNQHLHRLGSMDGEIFGGPDERRDQSVEIVDSRAEFLEPWSSETVDEGDV